MWKLVFLLEKGRRSITRDGSLSYEDFIHLA